MFRRWFACAAVLAAGLSPLAPTAAEAGTPPPLPPITQPPPFGCVDSGPYTVCTNDVTGRTASDAVVVDYLKDLVDRTDAGDSLRISMFTWWYHKVNSPFDYQHIYDLTHAVIDAYQRGVDIKILMDDRADPDKVDANGDYVNPDIRVPGLTQPLVELRNALGDNVTVCGENGHGCLRNGNENAINHNKFFLFDIDGHKRTVITSQNLVPWVQQAYGNLVDIRKNDVLYDFMSGYWTRLHDGSWYGWSGKERERLGSPAPDGVVETKAYVWPRPKYQDPLLDVLHRVTACPDAYNRKIWMSYEITQNRLDSNGDAMLDELIRLSNLGCSVKILVSQNVLDLDPNLKSVLTGTGATVVAVPRAHHKFAVVDATATGIQGQAATPREFVWTGSHNMTWSSAWRNGESAVVVEDHTVVRSYASHFVCVWNRNRVTGGDGDSDC